MSIDTSTWTQVGTTSNATIYRIAEDILGIVPIEDSNDTELTAKESLAFQTRYWQTRGARGGTVVFMDPVRDQDAGARAVYAGAGPGFPSTCFALVGEAFFAYAAAAVFTGLARPGVPTNIFRSLADALPWIAEQNRERGGAA